MGQEKKKQEIIFFAEDTESNDRTETCDENYKATLVGFMYFSSIVLVKIIIKLYS